MMPTFEVEDYSGKIHKYRFELHPPTNDGIALSLELMALGGTPLLGAIKEVASVTVAKKKKGEKFSIADALDLNLDIGSIGENLQRSLLSPQAGSIPQRLMKHAARDGQPLDNPFNFDQAFAGNYLELGKAMYEVIIANRFLPLPSISGENE